MESQNIPSVSEKKKFNGLLFLEVGLAEVFSVIFVLTLIFATLNYFGFLPISESFPFLSFLPQKQTAIRSGTTINPNKKPLLKPTRMPIIPEAVKKDMQSFAKTYIKPSLILSSFDVKPAMSATGTILDPNRFGASWPIENEAIMNISARYGQNFAAQDRSVLVTLPQPITSLGNLSAETNVAKYLLIQAKGTWSCGKEMTQGKEFTNCTNFWIDTQGVKKEIGIISFLSILNNQNASIAFCERYPQSPTYTWKSCYSQK